MRILFQTGTAITSENLNLAHLATGKPGVLSGCEVYIDDNYLIVSKGCVQFYDGVLVYLDGSDKLQWDNLPHNKYYMYLVNYGNDYSLEISILLPEDYKYVVLAEIEIEDNNTITINNVKKSTTPDQEKVIDGYSLYANSIVDNVEATFEKDSTLFFSYTKLSINNEGYFVIPFTYPNFEVKNIILRASLSSDTELNLELLHNGINKYTSEILRSTDFENNKHVFDLKEYANEIKNGDLCAIKLNLSQTINEENNDSDVVIYSVLLQT